MIRYRTTGGPVNEWVRVTMINLSAGGIRFRCGGEPLQAGTPLEIEIMLSGLPQPMTLPAAIVWNQLQASGVTEVGAQFQTLDMSQQLLIDRLAGFLSVSA